MDFDQIVSESIKLSNEQKIELSLRIFNIDKEYDNQGQIVLYTGLMDSKEGIVPHELDDEEKS